jgi:hypothetical protein
MTETIFAENMFGVKSYYDLNVVSRSNDHKEITIKTWNGKLTKLQLDDKKKCYVYRD